MEQTVDHSSLTHKELSLILKNVGSIGDFEYLRDGDLDMARNRLEGVTLAPNGWIAGSEPKGAPVGFISGALSVNTQGKALFKFVDSSEEVSKRKGRDCQTHAATTHKKVISKMKIELERLNASKFVDGRSQLGHVDAERGLLSNKMRHKQDNCAVIEVMIRILSLEDVPGKRLMYYFFAKKTEPEPTI